MQFLMGLDDVYLPIRSNILTRDPLPSVKFAFAIISGEESHRGVVSNSTPSKPHATAFVSKGFENKKPGRGPNPKLKCTNCLKTGHTIEKCFDLVGYPPNYKKPNGQASKGLSQAKIASNSNAVSERPSTSSPVSLTNEHMIRLMNLINDKPASPISANMACTLFNGSLKFNANFQKFFSSNNKEEDGDSRATSMDDNTPPDGITETFLDPIPDNSDKPAETVALRRSSRPSRVPQNLNDFVIEGKVKYGLERVFNYSNPSKDNFCFTSNLNKSIEPKTYQEAILENNWINAMNNEMEALNRNKTWIITDFPPNRKAIGCKWAPRKWNEKLVLTLSEHGFIKSESDHSLFIKNTNDIFVALLVYVDDIVITGNDSVEISKVKEFLSSKFQIKDLGK
nr:hypothetical protein [Tanacetum cinerariifolium]